MIRFRCGQCGHRLLIQKRQLGSVVICPDCAAPTHPVAEQMAAGRKPPHAGMAVSTLAPTHSCANCSQSIGRLQKLHLWENHLVCGECHRKLSRESAGPVESVTVTRVNAQVPARGARSEDLVAQTLTRPFRGGLFGALVGLCVAAAALYGAMSLLRDVAGVVTGLAIGGMALLLIYTAVRTTLLGRRESCESRPRQHLRVADSPRLRRLS